MRVFVTGATGFVGSAVVEELLGAGHSVLGLARSEAGAKAVAAAGAEVQRGTLEDLDGLSRGAAETDGVIHTAFIHDFVDLPAAGETDRRAIEALGAPLVGTGRPLVVASGLFGAEDEPPDPNSGVTHRHASEAATMALAGRGVRAMLVRLSPSVHGVGDHGFVPRLIAIAREKGVSAYIGDGANRWPAVHRLDAARLFRLGLEKGTAGARYHGVGDEGVPIRDIAAVIGKRLGLPVVPISREAAAGHFGFLAHFLAGDLPSTSAKTQAALDWQPTHPGLIADLDQPHYFAV
jgi:nucleoside-diphosphate-sugar epimerase